MYVILQENSYPVVVIAIFIDKPTPFLKEFFDDVFNQTYPKNRVYLFVYNAVSNFLCYCLHSRMEVGSTSIPVLLFNFFQCVCFNIGCLSSERGG